MGTQQQIALCPECSAKMIRMGTTWSGRHKVRRWQCPKCGRVTIRPKGSTSATLVEEDMSK